MNREENRIRWGRRSGAAGVVDSGPGGQSWPATGQRSWTIQQMFLFPGRSNLRCEGGVGCVINTQRQTVGVPSWGLNWWWLISAKSQALSVAIFRGDW